MATTITSRLVMEIVDRVTAPARGIASSITGISRAARGANGLTFGQRLNAAIERNNAALSVARGRMFDAVAGFYALRSAIAAPVSAAMQFEEVMADITKVVDFPSPEGLAQFQRELFALSRQVPLSVQELGQIAAAAGEAGFAAGDLLEVTTDAARIAVAFGTSAREAGDMLAAMRQSYGMSRDEALGLADAMNHLSNNMASSAPELMEFWTRIAADAGRAGFTQEQAVALGSAMVASGHGADVAATSFRAMVRALTRGESATTRQQAAYEALGLTASEVAVRMQEDAVGTTREVLERLSQLPAEVQNAMMSDLFGDEARALGSIATNLEFFDRAVNAVADSTTYAGSAMREYNARSQTFAANTQRFRNMVTELSVAIGNALIPALTRLMEIFAPMVTKLAELAAAYPEVTTAIVGTAAAVVALKVASAGLSYLGLVGRGGLLSGIALGYRTIGRASIHLSTAARETIRYNAALAAMSGASVSRIGTVAAGMRGIGLAVPGVAALSGALTAIGAALGAITAPVWATFAAIVAAIAAAGLSIYRYWDRLSAIFSGVGRRLGEAVLPAFEGLRPVLEWFAPMGETIANGWRRLTGIFTGLGSAISGMFSREVLTDDQRQTWEQWAYQLTDSFIAGIAAIPTRIREALAPMTQAGRALVQAFWDGMTAVFGELIAWVGSQVDRVISPFRNAASTVRSYLPEWAGGTTAAPDGARASGGPISRGGTYMVGERGPELITASQSGYVHTAAATARSGGGANINLGGITVNAAPGMNAMDVARQVRAELERAMQTAFNGIQGDVGMTTY